MESPVTPDLHPASAATTRRLLSRWIAATAIGAMVFGTASSSQARKKGGKKKKFCKCAPGFHCENGKCVPDA